MIFLKQTTCMLMRTNDAITTKSCARIHMIMKQEEVYIMVHKFVEVIISEKVDY